MFKKEKLLMQRFRIHPTHAFIRDFFKKLFSQIRVPCKGTSIHSVCFNFRQTGILWTGFRTQTE